MSDSVKDPLAHAYRGHLLHLPYEDVGAPRWTDFKAGYQAATAAADAEWRGVVERIRERIHAERYECTPLTIDDASTDAEKELMCIIDFIESECNKALAQAEKLMGSKP